jgi:hypothetical protein
MLFSFSYEYYKENIRVFKYFKESKCKILESYTKRVINDYSSWLIFDHNSSKNKNF